MKRFHSLEDALLASQRIHAHSSVTEIAKILRYVGQGVLHERLFGLGQLRPVIEWMQKDVPFPKIVRLIWSQTLDKPPHHIKCWTYFNRSIEPMRGEVSNLRDAMRASERITATSNRAEIANILRYAGDGALSETLLAHRNLGPIITALRTGIPFADIVMFIWDKARREDIPIGGIASWSFIEGIGRGTSNDVRDCL